ncbi:MAG: hypothetical protein EOP85_07170, partial [Verrucomicrobiaceae bacterium]
MSAFTEFVLIAIALYLWESTLWLPLRGIALRRKWRGKGWKAVDPATYMAGKELGLVPLLPFPPDFGIAPCQAPPISPDEGDGFLLERTNGNLLILKSLEWNDLSEKDHFLVAGGSSTRMTSPRYVDLLRRAKQRGASPRGAVTLAWRLALSPTRAGREWRRWMKVSGPFRISGPLLATGFFGGLPLTYIYLGIIPMLIVVAWLWLLMIWTAARLWWLGRRAYPAARTALRMDAFLCLFVPFHAMRAFEIASVHAMGTTHPVALILSSGDSDNPWLAKFVRRILHPLPGSPGEVGFSAAFKPMLARALAHQKKSLADYDLPSDRSDDPESTCYCPRCHAR